MWGGAARWAPPFLYSRKRRFNRRFLEVRTEDVVRVRKFLCVLLALCLSPSLAAEAGVVLVLSGGGTRGFAHIGVIEALITEGRLPPRSTTFSPVWMSVATAA